MLSKKLISWGLVLTPYFILNGRDLRDIKLEMAGMVALALGLSTFYEYGIKPFRNKWLLILVWLSCVSYFLAPAPRVEMFGMNVTQFWVWQPMYYFVVFTIMLVSVSSIPFTNKDIDKILRVMSWSGFVMAVYVILQFFGLDQIFESCTDGTYGRMAGFIGNPTHVSPYIAMIVPVCLYMRRYTMAGIMCIAVALTCSDVSTIALVSCLGYMYYYWREGNSFIVIKIVIVSVILGIILYKFGILNRDMVVDHERFSIWMKIIKDVGTPQLANSKKLYSLTGLGMGNFKYVFHFQHGNSFWQAHNEYLEFLSNNGLFGLGLLVTVIYKFFKDKRKLLVDYSNKNRELAIALMAGVVCMVLTAGGTFIWQVGTTAWYTILFVGLMNNPILGGKQDEKSNSDIDFNCCSI